ncbi:MAG: alpha-2-macroglobulin family protein [Planctomycetota bacterium]
MAATAALSREPEDQTLRIDLDRPLVVFFQYTKSLTSLETSPTSMRVPQPAPPDLAALFQEHRTGLAAAVRGVLGPGAEVQEVLQEAFLRVWRARDRQVQEGNLVGFVFVVTLNLARDLRRKERRLGRTTPLEEVSEMRLTSKGPPPTERAERTEAVAAAREAILKLEVVDPLDRPTSAKGKILDAEGRQVASFETSHQGRARFLITPRPGESYRLEFSEPEAAPVPLPVARSTGPTLRSLRDSYAPGEPLALAIHTPGNGPWMVGAFLRGILVAHDTFSGSGDQEIALDLPERASGVLRITLFDPVLTPVAERLVHRSSGRDLVVEIDPVDPSLAPGDHQQVEITTRDDQGKPVAAIVGLTVTDRAVRDLYDEARVGLVDQAYLLADVGDLEDVHEFLAHDAESARNIDLLLGTRGWRRFAWVDPGTFLAEHGQESGVFLAREALAQAPQVVDTSHARMETFQDLSRDSRLSRRFALFATVTVGLLFVLMLLAWGAERFARYYVSRGLPVRIAFGVLLGVVPVLLAGFFLVRSKVQPMMAGDEAAPVMARFAANAVHDEPAGEAAEDLPRDDGADAWKRFAAFAQVRDDRAAPENRFDEPLALVEHDIVEGQDFEPDAGRMKNLAAFGYLVRGEDEEGVFFDQIDRGRLRMDWQSRQYLVREYAHENPRGPTRDDFSETVYWNAGLATDADGKARVEFDVSDSVTTWSVFADAHGAGRLGQGSAEFEAKIPFRMEPVLPVEVTEGDRLQLPVALLCEDPEIDRVTVHAEASGPLEFAEDPSGELPIAAGRWLIPVVVTGANEEGRITLSGNARRWGDRVEHALRIVPKGFPQKLSRSGRVDGLVRFNVTLPESMVPGSLSANLKLYPSPLATILDGMDGLLQEPCGCFEQASSSNYPNLMALAYMEAAGGDDPALMKRSRELLERGYGLITGYECSERGYEWFGADPGHEALTAYGLLEFHDMSTVYNVDREMLERTRQWILGRRDGKGGFGRNERALDSFGAAPQAVTDAYVTYALLSTGSDPSSLKAEVDRMEERAQKSDDPYEIALAASSLQHAGRTLAADQARDRLKSMQQGDGAVAGTTSSITSSRGTNLEVETTGFAVLAWLEDPDDRAAVEQAMTFLLGQRSATGRFGATQATIVAMKALTAYAEAARTVVNDGQLTISINGRKVHEETVHAGQRGALQFDWLGKSLQPGDNEIVLELSGGNEFPYAFDLDSFAEQPADDPDGAVEIDVALAKDTVEEGMTVPLSITVRNRSEKSVPMTLAIVGLPAGLHADRKILDDLQEAGRFDLWEIKGRELIFYWRGLAERSERKVDIDLVARIPGVTTGPASRAYLYYTDNQKCWADPLTVTVLPAR